MRTRTLPTSPHECDASLDASSRTDKMIAQASSRNRSGDLRPRSENTSERWMWRAVVVLVMLLA
jgi:hypothetical protein